MKKLSSFSLYHGSIQDIPLDKSPLGMSSWAFRPGHLPWTLPHPTPNIISSMRGNVGWGIARGRCPGWGDVLNHAVIIVHKKCCIVIHTEKSIIPYSLSIAMHLKQHQILIIIDSDAVIYFDHTLFCMLDKSKLMARQIGILHNHRLECSWFSSVNHTTCSI